ncbi:MAG TPA: hypothetical protein VJR89_01555, partial [Polyangiales bacterium]|nr:hypothetical protein [Polyangiales bacterium]
ARAASGLPTGRLPSVVCTGVRRAPAAYIGRFLLLQTNGWQQAVAVLRSQRTQQPLEAGTRLARRAGMSDADRKARTRRGVSVIEVLVLLALLGLGTLASVRAISRSIVRVGEREAECIAALTPCDPLGSAVAPEAVPHAGPQPRAAPQPVAPELAGLQPCTLRTYEASRRESYTIGWNYSEFGKAYSHDTLSNGTEVIYEGNWNGEGADLGGALVVPIVGPIKVQLAGGVTVSGATENGYVWLLDSAEKQAAEKQLRAELFAEAYIDRDKFPSLKELLKPGAVLDAMKRGQYRDAIRHQNVDRVVTKVGRSGQVTLGADAVGLSADLSIGAGAVKTIEQDQHGVRAVSFEVNAAGSGELGAIMLGERSRTIDGKFTVTVSLDDAGAVTGVDIASIQGLRAGMDPDGDLARFQSLATSPQLPDSPGKSTLLYKRLSKLGEHLSTTFEYTDRDEAGAAARTSVHLDPRNGFDRQALGEFLNAPNARNIERLLGDPAWQDAAIDVQYYHGKGHVEDLTVKAQLGAGLGGSSNSTEKRLVLADAYSVKPSGAVHRTDCLGR